MGRAIPLSEQTPADRHRVLVDYDSGRQVMVYLPPEPEAFAGEAGAESRPVHDRPGRLLANPLAGAQFGGAADNPPGSASQYEQTSTSSIPGPLKTADRIP
jgi:hypothetical protein